MYLCMSNDSGGFMDCLIRLPVEPNITESLLLNTECETCKL